MTIDSLQLLAAEVCINNHFHASFLIRNRYPDDIVNAMAEAEKVFCLRYARTRILDGLRTFIRPSTTALVFGLKRRNDLNGSQVEVLFWDESTCRWAVKHHESGNSVKVKPDNLLPLFEKLETLELKELIATTAAQTKQNALHVFMLDNDRRAAWDFIRDGYKSCPLMVLYPAFEILDITQPRGMIVSYAKRVQEPICSLYDIRFCQQMTSVLKRWREDTAQEHVNHDTWNYQNDEKVEAEDVPVLCWFLAFMQLDCEDFAGALDSLSYVISDISEGRWSKTFLSEVLYYIALAEFGIGNKDGCGLSLEVYDSIAHELDRHRRDAGILQLWAGSSSAEAFSEAMNGALEELKTKLSSEWDTNTFSATPWVHAKVASALGIEFESPYKAMVEVIENAWRDIRFPRPRNVDETINAFLRPGFPHGVTVRYRMTTEQKNEETADEKRMAKVILGEYYYDSD